MHREGLFASRSTPASRDKASGSRGFVQGPRRRNSRGLLDIVLRNSGVCVLIRKIVVMETGGKRGWGTNERRFERRSKTRGQLANS